MKEGLLRSLLMMLALLAIGSTADAQQAQKRPTVGFLLSGSAASPSPFIEAFENGLRALGWVKDQNMTVEYRYAEGNAERFPDLVNELVRLPVDVIVAGPAPAAVAAKKATTTIPIVITLGADPFAFGLMDSHTPQSGNITGLTETTPELTPKRLMLLKQIMPVLTRAAILSQPGMLRAETFDVRVALDSGHSAGVSERPRSANRRHRRALLCGTMSRMIVLRGLHPKRAKPMPFSVTSAQPFWNLDPVELRPRPHVSSKPEPIRIIERSPVRTRR